VEAGLEVEDVDGVVGARAELLTLLGLLLIQLKTNKNKLIEVSNKNRV
jgi:hypothetical protein